MRRAIDRSAWASAAETGSRPATGGGRLAQRAIAGESIHSITNGSGDLPSDSWPGARDAGRRGGGQRDAAGHPPVEPAEIEPRAEVRLRGGHPLEHPPPAHEQTEQRPRDGVGHQPGLVREERDHEPDLREREREIRADGAQVAPLRDPEASRHDPGEKRQQRWGARWSRGRTRSTATAAASGSVHPATSASQADGAEQRAAQIVEHLPAADHRDRGAAGRAVRAGPGAEDPGKQLPVAARPAMLPGRGDVVA